MTAMMLGMNVNEIGDGDRDAAEHDDDMCPRGSCDVVLTLLTSAL